MTSIQRTQFPPAPSPAGGHKSIPASAQQPKIAQSAGFPSSNERALSRENQKPSVTPLDTPSAQRNSSSPSMGHAVGPEIHDNHPSVPQEAILPKLSPGGGMYSYYMHSDNHGNSALYRFDKSAKTWESSALPTRPPTGDSRYTYVVSTDNQGRDFVEQTERSETNGKPEIHTRAFVVGDFKPSGKLSDTNFIVPPEYQLPATGRHGEKYSYSVIDQPDNRGNTQHLLERYDQTNKRTAVAYLGHYGEYSVKTDSQGNQYLDKHYADPHFEPNSTGPQKASEFDFYHPSPDASA